MMARPVQVYPKRILIGQDEGRARKASTRVQRQGLTAHMLMMMMKEKLLRTREGQLMWKAAIRHLAQVTKSHEKGCSCR